MDPINKPALLIADMLKKPLYFFLVLTLVSACTGSRNEDNQLLENLMKKADKTLKEFLSNRMLLIQIIYTPLDRDQDNCPSIRFTMTECMTIKSLAFRL